MESVKKYLMPVHSVAKFKHMVTVVLAICLLICSSPLLCAEDNPTKKVLVLNSYHQGFAWSDGITEGIKSELKGSRPDIEIDIEYMDTKRIYDKKHLANLYELYKHKFRKRDYDLILTSDDNAFSFVLKYHDELFRDKPVVFCGLNSLDKSLEAHLSKLGWITGSVEMYDIKGNLDLIRKLHPNVKQIAVICDTTISSQKCKRKVQEAESSLPASIKFYYLEEDAYMESIIAQVKELPPDSIILLMSFFKDRGGAYYSPETGGKMISEKSPFPNYSAWDFYLGHGITGGLITSSNAQGEIGAKIALRVLNGEKISDIPVTKEPANYYMFDYNELKRFGIKHKDLPDNSIVINKPYSFYSEHKSLIHNILGAISVLTLTIIVLVVNILRRRQAEKSLRESEERFRTFIDAASFEGIVLNDNGIIRDINHQFAAMYGYEREELIGMDPLETIAHEYREIVSKHMKEGYEKAYEAVALRKDGSRFPIEIHARNIPFRGRTVRTAAVWDITNRKRDEEALRESEEKYRITIQSTPDSVTITRVKDGRYMYVNDGFCQITGYSREEVIGKTPSDLNLIVNPADRDELIRMLREKDEVTGFEIQYRLKDGAILDTILSARPLKYGKEDCLVAVVKDITSIKQAENERIGLETQLRQARKMEAIGTLAGGIAHDFNNILAAIIGYTELGLLNTSNEKKIKHSFEAVLTAGNRAKDLVKQILTFSRQTEQEKKPVKISLIIKECINMLRSSLPATIEIKQNITSDSDSVLADPTQINQVLMNLCTNAAHAMREDGGILEVSLRNISIVDSELWIADPDKPETRIPKSGIDYPDIKTGPYLELSVSDTGHGIEDHDLEWVFDPYYTTKKEGEGTGLGLAVVRGIVHGHGGGITVQSEEGKGSTFHVYLPVIERVIEPKTEEFQSLPRGSEHILFVDDEEALVDIAKQILTQLGYHVDTKTSSIEALEAFRAQPDMFDLVITDMTMPVMTGDKLAKKLLEIRGNIPIILCTGFNEKISSKKAKAMGIREFAMKPLLARDLAKTIHKVLEE